MRHDIIKAGAGAVSRGETRLESGDIRCDHVCASNMVDGGEGESPVRAVWFLALSCSNYGSPPPSHELRNAAVQPYSAHGRARSSSSIVGDTLWGLLQLLILLLRHGLLQLYQQVLDPVRPLPIGKERELARVDASVRPLRKRWGGRGWGCHEACRWDQRGRGRGLVRRGVPRTES